MTRFLSNHPNIRRGVVATAGLALPFGAGACSSDFERGANPCDPRLEVNYVDCHVTAQDYLTSTERAQNYQGLLNDEVQKLLDAQQENPKKMGLYFIPESSPNQPRHLGSEGSAEWGLLTNMWGGGEGNVTFSAAVFMDVTGKVDLDMGVTKIHATVFNQQQLTEGDVQVTIISPEENWDAVCLAENAPPSPSSKGVKRNQIWTGEVRVYDQHGDSPFGEWKVTTDSCEFSPSVEKTADQLRIEDEQALKTLQDLLQQVGNS